MQNPIAEVSGPSRLDGPGDSSNKEVKVEDDQVDVDRGQETRPDKDTLRRIETILNLAKLEDVEDSLAQQVVVLHNGSRYDPPQLTPTRRRRRVPMLPFLEEEEDERVLCE